MIDICYYSSDLYAPYTGISMYSLCKNNPELEFRIDCIDTGISDINKDKMRAVAEEFEKEIIFYDFSTLESYIRDELKLPVCGGSYATYIKVFPDRIFKGMDRILFMDGDTIINGSLKMLEEIDLKSAVFAAAKVPLVLDMQSYKENREDNLRLKYALKFQNIGYYNIGVFYVNLKKWQEVDYGSQIMAMKDIHMDIIKDAKDVPFDEMLINLAALENKDKGYAYSLSPIFNSTSHQIPYLRARQIGLMTGYLSKKDINDSYFKPTIIHYCIFKPWFTDTFSPHRGKVKRYKKESPWPDAFEDCLYKTRTDRYFGKLAYSMPTERMMHGVISLGHLYLRTRARFRMLKQRIANRII